MTIGKTSNKIQQKLLKQNAIKRNKKIFDISLIDTIESQDEMFRRVPFNSATEHISLKLDNSLLNSTQQFSLKVQKDTEKFRERLKTCQNQESQGKQRKQRNQKFQAFSLNSVGFPKNGLLYSSIAPKNQRRFDNFTLTQPNASKIRPFEHYLSRKQKINTQEQQQSAHLVTKSDYKTIKTEIPSQNNYFKKQLSRKQVNLYPKFSSFLLTDIQPQKIQKGLSLTKTNWHRTTLNNFQHFSSKENPCQFQRNFHPPNMCYRQKKQIEKKSGQTIPNNKEMIEVDFERWEICPIKYFRIKTLKDKRRYRRTQI